MYMRIGYTVTLSLIMAALVYCAVDARRTGKGIGRYVKLLGLVLVPPILGNLIIINSPTAAWAALGCYIYFIGMDLVMLRLIGSSVEYCKGAGTGQKVPMAVYGMLAADTVQLFADIFTHHVYELGTIDTEYGTFYQYFPKGGLVFHRIVIYLIFFSILLIFTILCKRMPKIYRQKYTVILSVMVLAGLWQTYDIFSGTPIDRSMIGFGAFGLLVYYFSIVYRPLKLLDRMLSSIAADVFEALYVFDPNKRCIWANSTGLKLAGISEDELEQVLPKLAERFGEMDFSKKDLRERRIIGTGDSARYFSFEKQNVTDDSLKLAGSYLIVWDNTEEQRRVQREIFNSIHDGLSGLYRHEVPLGDKVRRQGRHHHQEYHQSFRGAGYSEPDRGR